MTSEEFENKYDEPVDIDQVHTALKRFIDGKGRMSIPASPEDDDMLICRLMNEVKKHRKQKSFSEEYRFIDWFD